VWDVTHLNSLLTLKGHLAEVWCVALAPDGQSAVSGGKDGSLLGWDFRRQAAWHVRCLKAVMLNPAIVRPANSNIISGDFWLRLLSDEQLRDFDDLEKLVLGCEIIAALDTGDLLAA
jgi:WD40 repeat protein